LPKLIDVPNHNHLLPSCWKKDVRQSDGILIHRLLLGCNYGIQFEKESVQTAAIASLLSVNNHFSCLFSTLKTSIYWDEKYLSGTNFSQRTWDKEKWHQNHFNIGKLGYIVDRNKCMLIIKLFRMNLLLDIDKYCKWDTDVIFASWMGMNVVRCWTDIYFTGL
jgi:hypothetical protein